MRNSVAQENKSRNLDIDIYGELVDSYNMERYDQQSGLSIEAQIGNHELVSRYLNNGANIERTFNGLTPLAIALQNGHEICAIELIRQGANVNFLRRTDKPKWSWKFPYHVTPLYIAAEKGLLNCVQLLCEHGADLTVVCMFNVKSDGNYVMLPKSPLMLALENGHTECAKELIERVKIANIPTNEINDNWVGPKTLFIAAEKGNLECLKLLHITSKYLEMEFEDGPEANSVKGRMKYNVLEVTLKNNHLECALYLISKGAVENLANKKVVVKPFLYMAAEQGNISCIQSLCLRGDDVNCQYNSITPLMIALENGYAECAVELVNNGAVLNTDLITRCMPIVSEKGHIGCIRLLFQYSERLNFVYNDSRSITAALQSGHAECAIELMRNDVSISVDLLGEYVYIAAEKGFLDCIKLLSENNADINFVHKLITPFINANFTPLLIATQNNHVECVEFLVIKGATLGILQKGIRSPVRLLAEKGKIDALRVLCENNADVNFIDHYSEDSPLTAATKNNHAGCVDLLLRFGASIVYQAQSWTPLHCAAKFNSAECAKLLLLYGADLYARDRGDQTPLMLATSERSNQVIAIIQKFMKDGAQAFDDSTSEIEVLRETVARQNEEIAQLKLIIAQSSNFNQQDAKLPVPDRSLIFSAKRTIPEPETTTELVANKVNNSATTASLTGKSKTIPTVWGI